MSYHQQTSRAQYLAKLAAQPFYPLQFCMFPPFRLLSPVTFCLPGTFLTHTHHTVSVPFNHVAPLGIAIQPIARGTEPSNRHRYANCQSGI